MHKCLALQIKYYFLLAYSLSADDVSVEVLCQEIGFELKPAIAYTPTVLGI